MFETIIKKYKMNWKGEICKVCKREQRIAWSIVDNLWDKVVNVPYKNRVVCLECFLKMADKKGINVRIEDFLFLGWVGNNINPEILLDKNRRNK